jgi:Ser/Thr protein kinase RdoA (MazF antagonist)
MLWQADATLVCRDAAIPGLATLLDDAAFAAALWRALPEAGVESARATYIRYKPGTSCTVCYRVRSRRGEAWVHARAFSPALRDKLDHARELGAKDGALGVGGCVLDDLAIAVYGWPHDRQVGALARLADPAKREELLRRLAPGHPELWGAELRDLRYKPERRYVGLLEGAAGARALLKLYAEEEYPPALAGARAFAPSERLALAGLIGHSERRHALLFEWLPGRPLQELLGHHEAEAAARDAGAALAELHARAHRGATAPQKDPPAVGEPLRAAAAMIAALSPEAGEAAGRLARHLAAELKFCDPPTPIHGDFHAGQVLVQHRGVALLDMDNFSLGNPAADLGSFAAHLVYETISGGLPGGAADGVVDALLAGYCAGEPPYPVRELHLHTAAWLLRLAPEAFRYRAPDWPERIRATVARAEELATHAYAGT